MNRCKRLILPVFAAIVVVVVALGSSSFKKSVPEKKNAGPFYWVMINASDETSGTARVDKTKYQKAGGTGSNPVTCNGVPQRLCQLYLVDDGNTSDPKPAIPASTSDPLYIKLYNSNNPAPQTELNVIFAKQN